MGVTEPAAATEPSAVAPGKRGGHSETVCADGAKPQQSPDTTEIGDVKADGVNISASLGGESGAAKIYWALVGRRVAVLTLFRPDKQTQQLAPAWDLVRTSLKVHDPKAVPTPSP